MICEWIREKSKARSEAHRTTATEAQSLHLHGDKCRRQGRSAVRDGDRKTRAHRERVDPKAACRILPLRSAAGVYKSTAAGPDAATVPSRARVSCVLETQVKRHDIHDAHSGHCSCSTFADYMLYFVADRNTSNIHTATRAVLEHAHERLGLCCLLARGSSVWRPRGPPNHPTALLYRVAARWSLCVRP